MIGIGDWSIPKVSSLREESLRQKPSSTKLWNGANCSNFPALSEEADDEVEGLSAIDPTTSSLSPSGAVLEPELTRSRKIRRCSLRSPVYY